MSGDMFQVALRRIDTSQPWGFRLKGGADQGIPLHVEQCSPNSRASKAGLAAGDAVLSIGGVDTSTLSHAQVKQEVLRAGNEVDLVIQRGGFTQDLAAATPPPTQPKPQPKPQQPPRQMRSRPVQQNQGDEPRAQVVEEPVAKMGGPTYKQVTPKTYKVLQDELPASEVGATGRPASIFDRRKQERSGYLHAKGKTIQKAYGES